MKGYFKLKACPDGEYLLFGNLTHYDIELVAVGNLLYEDNIGRMVAHDVIEHTVAHRTAKTVTVEEELFAVGALAYVRPQYDTYNEVDNLLEYVRRPLRVGTIPYYDMNLYDFNYADEAKKYFGENAAEEVRKINWWLNYGYRTKELQFNSQGKAYNAFEFIRREVNEVVRYQDWGYFEYLRCYFDTELKVFRATEVGGYV